MESQNIYRIVWKNKKNQHIGCGTQLFNINEANDFVKILNKKFNNDIHHWIQEKSEIIF
jgi:hypothetical protein